MSRTSEDLQWMERALEWAREAEKRSEVPVGAVVVQDGKLISSGFNRRESDQSPLAHAELDALSAAAKILGTWRLSNCTLYVTMEPCIMCAGAILQSRIARLVYGTRDPKGGAVDSLYQVCTDSRLNHQVEVVSGVLKEPCSQILTEFFQKLRRAKK